MRFPAKITSSCIWVGIPVDRVILHWYARLGVDVRRSVGVRSRYYHFFWDGKIYLPMVLRWRARELCYYTAIFWAAVT